MNFVLEKIVIKFKHSIELAHQTLAVAFTKPADFQFVAGQHVLLTVPIKQDGFAGYEARHLSIASSPQDDELVFIVRLRNSPFKNALNTMSAGTECFINQASGKFILSADDNNNIVFLVGGVGIAPVLSILSEFVNSNKKASQITVFCSNRTPQDEILANTLQKYEDTIQKYKYIPTMSRLDSAESEWVGLRGRITKGLLENTLHDIPSNKYYIVGPQPMVVAMEDLLTEFHMPKESVITSKFCGYDGYFCKSCKDKHTYLTAPIGVVV
jgi:ferredoxin-NADP reductase